MGAAFLATLGGIGAITGGDLQIAERARAMLGAEIPSVIVRVAADESAVFFARNGHAVVFWFEERLWFYTPHSGTGSPRQPRQGWHAQLTDLKTVLRNKEPAIQSVEIVPSALSDSIDDEGRGLPNACWIQSWAAYRRLRAIGEIDHAYLLSFHVVQPPDGLVRHTVLAWNARGGWWAYDPGLPDNPQAFAPTHEAPDAFAESLRKSETPGRLRNATWIRLQPAETVVLNAR